MAQYLMMNSANRPQRSGGSRRRERARGDSARRITQRRQADRAAIQSAPPTHWGRLRAVAPVIGIPLAVVVLGIIVAAFAVLLLMSRPLAMLPASVASVWLVLNLSPITLGGISFGVAPLLPAMGLLWLLSRRIYLAVRERISLADLSVLTGFALGMPLALTLIALGMVHDAAAVYPVAVPPIAPALLKTLLVHLIALVIGMRARLWKALARNFSLPEWLVDAALAAARFITAFSAAALLSWLIFALAGWNRQLEVFADYGSGAGVAAVLVLTLLYLPNAAVAMAAILVGSEFHIGEASISLFSIHLIPLPPLPLFAAIPGQTQWWGMALMAIPALIAAALCYSTPPKPKGALVTGAFAGLFALVAGYLASGSLGVYGDTGPLLALFGLLTFGWLSAVGLIAAGVGAIAARCRQSAEVKETSATESAVVPDLPEEIVEPDLAAEAEVIEEAEVVAEIEETEDAATVVPAPSVQGEEGDDGGVDKQTVQ